MWVRSGHTVAPPATPPDTGEVLASFPRADGEELRLAAAEFNGAAYLALRVWRRDRSGCWWPVAGKGVSVRVGEAGGMAEALAAYDRQRQADGPKSLRPARAKASERQAGRSKASRDAFEPRPAATRRPGSTWTPPGPTPDQTAATGPRFDDCPEVEETTATAPERPTGHPGGLGEASSRANPTLTPPWVG